MNTTPRISCILPTANRRDFLHQSLSYFDAQDYPNKELIVVEDGIQSNADIFLGHPHVVYVMLAGTHSIGAKRNYACALASGEILCHWDDDDYYGPKRLSQQAEPILRGQADITGMRMVYALSLPSCTLYECSAQEHERLFVHNVRAGTLMYLAQYYTDGLRYADKSHGEDVTFLNDVLQYGGKLARIDKPESYVCVRHDGNVTPPLAYAGPGWREVPIETAIPAEQVDFYQNLGGKVVR